VNHHGKALFALPNLSKTSYADTFNWYNNDNIDMEGVRKRANKEGM